MRRQLGIVAMAMLLATVLAGPALAARQPKPIAVTVANTSACTFIVNATWDRAQRGQAQLTLYLVDRYGSYLYAIVPVASTTTSGSWTFTTTGTPQAGGAVYGHAWLNRSLSDPQKPYQLLAEGVSADLATSCRIPNLDPG